LRQRLLEPEHFELTKFSGDLLHASQRKGWLDIAAHPPHLVKVDHQVEVVTDRVPCRTDCGDSLGNVVSGDA